MTKYILAYHGKPDIQTKEQGADHMAAWQAWMAGLGDAVVDPGMPVSISKIVSVTGVADNGGANPLTGITIIDVPTMEEAIEIAQRCPHVSGDGTIEVAQAMLMDM